MLVRSSPSRAVRSSKRTATAGVRLLLESSVARVLLNVAAAAAECSCALLGHNHHLANASAGGPSLTTDR